MTTTNPFQELYAIDVSEHIEKKGQFSYLSWPYAVAELRKRHPTATWEVIRFNGLPYMKTELGYFVEVSVTVDGVTLSQIHPVLDARNKPIAQPTSFDINTSIQRCLVKAIGLHGLGLYIYAGEDLPESVKEEIKTKAEIEAQTFQTIATGMGNAASPEELQQWALEAKDFVDAGASEEHDIALRKAYSIANRKFKEAA